MHSPRIKTGTAFKLIKSCLEDRYRKVILDDKLPDSNSEWGEIRHGVPQGSILGPLLFLRYINDLLNIVNDNIEVVLYVDDYYLNYYYSQPNRYYS
jgi:hypothetical protein